MRILIATGIYPPQIGGPAQYAKGIEDAYRSMGHVVTIKTYGRIEYMLPIGIRHLFFALKSLWSYLRADNIIVLDTFSVALPIAILTSVFRKKFIIRTGGDFLWEAYVERTKKKVLFKDFYITEVQSDHDISITKKERFIFRMTKWIFCKADKIIFSTKWQKDIWMGPYEIEEKKVRIIGNYIGEKLKPEVPRGKYFVSATRNLVWKNADMVQDVFEDEEIKNVGVRLDSEKVEHQDFLNKISKSYAVILVSLGDISPNMILDAVRCGKPFICTIECGLYDTLKEIGMWVDPLNKEEIKDAVLWLAEERNYQDQCIKIASFKDVHNWNQIAHKLITL